ncbi:flagellar basal body rod protein FlgB [Pseudogracilibacillus sp. SO30301A]
MKLFDQIISTLESVLNYSSARNKIISNNIANVDAPNYKSQDVVFKNVFK